KKSMALSHGLRRSFTPALTGVRARAVALAGLSSISPGAGAGEAAQPAGPAGTLSELTRPASTIELGAGFTSNGAPAPRNLLGLRHEGLQPRGQLDLRGSQYSYDNPADDSTRWRIGASNLGLRAHDLSAEYGRQGWYCFSLAYDD